MRIVTAFIVVALLADPSDAANYYVATDGSNSNAGTLAKPFQTIQQAADMARAGDNVYILSGTYRETVTVANSGTTSAPITFQPYNGARVTLTGLDPVAGNWSVRNGTLYHTSIESGVSQVFVNGQLMLGARWPNPVYNNPLRAVQATIDSANIQSPPTASTITDTALSGAGNMAGGKLSITAGDEYVAYGTTIDAHNGDQLSCQWPYPAINAYTARAGNPYYIYNTLAALDAFKEWYYDSSAKDLYLKAPGGTNLNNQVVEVRTRQYGFDLGAQSNINISGLQLKAASIKIGGNANTVDNCQILYPRALSDPTGTTVPHHFGGVEISGQYNTVRNSEIAYSWDDGVTLTGAHNTVDNNVIHDVDWLGTDSAFVYSNNSGGHNTIANNKMYNSGRSGITNEKDSPDTMILHNDIDRFGLLTKDLGGTYTSLGNNTGSVVAYNHIQGNGGERFHAGIYLDNYTTGVTVHNNLVSDTTHGILINKNPVARPNNDSVYNNTLWKVSNAMAGGGPDGFVWSNVNTYNNLSDKSNWVGTAMQKNLYQTTDQFTNSAAGDYTLTDNSFFVKRAVDYGIADASHPTDPYTGSAPDAGAFEQGVAPWTAGANWKTWLFTNQTAAPLSSAVSVTSDNVRNTTGSLAVGNSVGIDSRAFLKFDLSNVSDVPITKAVLRIYENDLPESAGGDVSLYKVAWNWTDEDVTFNQNVAISNPVSGFYDPANLDFYTDIDITSTVLDWLSHPWANYGISLRGTEGTAGTAKFFDGFLGITAPQLVITYSSELIPGDADFDYDIDNDDAAILAANWLSTSATWGMGDFNGDEKVDDVDAVLLAANWHVGVRAAAAAPEPDTAIMLAIIGAMLLITAGHRRLRPFRRRRDDIATIYIQEQL